MFQSIIEFDISSIDKPTIVVVLAGQVIVVALLFLFYKLYTVLIPKVFKLLRKQKSVINVPGPVKAKNQEENDDLNAAIAMALYLHFNEMHDEESNVITIQRISKTYSPWSSKIYNMRNFR